MLLIVIAFVLGADSAMAVALVGLAGTIAVAGGGYLVSRRTTSGDIRRSTAADLWQAQESLRHDLESALRSSLEREASLRERVAVLEKEVEQLRKGMVP